MVTNSAAGPANDLADHGAQNRPAEQHGHRVQAQHHPVTSHCHPPPERASDDQAQGRFGTSAVVPSLSQGMAPIRGIPIVRTRHDEPPSPDHRNVTRELLRRIPTWNGDSASPVMLPATIRSPALALACPSNPSVWQISWTTV